MGTRRKLRRLPPALLLAALASALHAPPALNQPHEEIATGIGSASSDTSPLHLLESALRIPAYRLWEKAGFGGPPLELAAWVLAEDGGRVRWQSWPDGRLHLRAHWRGPVLAAAVAIVHTHPAVADPKPSPQDIETASRLGMPVYTVSRAGIWKADRDGHVVVVDDAGWWAGCRSGACGAPERDPEFRSASAPSDLRNLEAESAYR